MAVHTPTYTDALIYDSTNASYWETVTCRTGTVKTPTDPGLLRGTYVQVLFSRAEAAGVREDAAMFDLHLACATLASGDFTLLADADMAAVETALDTFWTAIKGSWFSHWIQSGYIWRDYGADFPVSSTTGYSKPGPIRRVTSRSVAGTSAAAGFPIDQAAMSVTFQTASRRHWGRFYLPSPASDVVDQYSRFTSAKVDTIAAAVNTLFDSITNLTPSGGPSGVGIHPLVWSPKYRGAFAVSGLSLDNVPDVIRRRRPKVRTYRKTYGTVI